MKILALACVAVAVAAAPLGAAEAPGPVRAHYEITLQKGRSTWTVAAGGTISSGVPVEHDTGPYRVSIAAFLEPSGHYTLQVSVGSIPHGPGALYIPDSRRFPGTLEFPLEFTTTLMGITVNGAITVARARTGTARAPASP